MILTNRNRLLIGAFDEDSPVVADHEVSLNDDVLCFAARVNANGGDLVWIGFDDVVCYDVMRGWRVELVMGGLIDCDVGVPDLWPPLAVRFATVERKNVAGDNAAERVGNPKSLTTAASDRVAVECAKLAAAFDVQ